MEIVDSVALVDVIDWRSLEDGQWLTAGAIDACVKYYCQKMLTVDEGMKQKFLYINASLSSALLNKPNDVTADCSLMEYSFNENIIFFPFNVDNTHWVLFICDFSNKRINFCDPLRKNLSGAFIKNWTTFLKVRNMYCQEFIEPRDLQFVFSNMQDVQKDDYNCGIYVVHYIMQTVCGLSKMEFFPDNVRKLVRESLELVFSNDISVGEHFGDSETVVFTKPLDIYDIDFNNNFLFYFSALLDTEWLAIVKNDECSYLFDYNYDSFYKRHDISCDFEVKKSLKINNPSIVYAVGSECSEDDCNAMFLCIVVFSNLKNVDLGVTVITKYFGSSCPHKPITRVNDHEVLHSNIFIDDNLHNFHVLRTGGFDYRLRAQSNYCIKTLTEQYRNLSMYLNRLKSYLEISNTLSEEDFALCFSLIKTDKYYPVVGNVLRCLHCKLITYNSSLISTIGKINKQLEQTDVINILNNQSPNGPNAQCDDIIFNNAKNNTNHFSNLCGSWILTESEVVQTNYLENHDHVKQLFSQKMIEIKNYCVLKYYSSRKNKKVKITNEGKRLASVFYARCKHEDCNNYVFRFLVDPNNTVYTLQLLSTKIGSNHKPGVFHALSLTGLRRQAIKEELSHKTAAMVRRDAILKADPEMLAAGNLSNIYSKNALQMARMKSLLKTIYTGTM